MATKKVRITRPILIEGRVDPAQVGEIVELDTETADHLIVMECAEKCSELLSFFTKSRGASGDR